MTRVSLPVVDGFYVVEDCCSNCGVPWHFAPELFEKGEWTCVLKRQPATEAELREVIHVVEVQDLGCIRYAGNDPAILDALSAAGEGDQCDALKPPQT